MEREALGFPLELRTPPLPAAHVEGGARPSSTNLEQRSMTSATPPILRVHSMRATSRRTTNRSCEKLLVSVLSSFCSVTTGQQSSGHAVAEGSPGWVLPGRAVQRSASAVVGGRRKARVVDDELDVWWWMRAVGCGQAPQQRLYFWPLPHGQGSLRPILTATRAPANAARLARSISSCAAVASCSRPG